MRWSYLPKTVTLQVMLITAPISRFVSAGILLLAGLSLAGRMRADTMFTNFGPNYAFAQGTGAIVTNDVQAYASVAVSFTPTLSYNLTSVQFVATDLVPSDANYITVGVFADNGSGQPGLVVESFLVDNLTQFGELAPVLSITSQLQPLLEANLTYWVGMSASPGDMIVWNQNSTGALGFSQTDGNGNWSSSGADQGALEVDGTLASSLSPASSGQFGVASTPEPAAWLLMFGGLAVVALQTRARVSLRRVVVRRSSHSKLPPL